MNGVPCDCAIGDTSFFAVASVIGPVSGAEVRRHFLRDSPEPIRVSGIPILASDLPGRRERAIDLTELKSNIAALLLLLECPAPDFPIWTRLVFKQMERVRALTAKALGKGS